MPENATQRRNQIVIFSADSHAASQLAQQFNTKGYRTFIQSSLTESAQWRIEHLALIVLLNCKEACASFQHYLAQIKHASSNVPIVCMDDTMPPPEPFTVDALADSVHFCPNSPKLDPETSRQQPGHERRRHERRLADRRHASRTPSHSQLHRLPSQHPPASPLPALPALPALPLAAKHAPIRLLIISKSRRLFEAFQASCQHDPAERIIIEWLADPAPASDPPAQPPPGLILLDTITPAHRMISLLQTVRHHYPTVRIILLDPSPIPNLVHHIVEFKICGLLPREASPELYRKALRVVRNGELWLPHPVISQIFALFSEEYQRAHQATAHAPRLTTREQAIAALVAQGWTNKEIAKQLDLSPETIKKHLKNIFAKLGTQTRSELTARYIGMLGNVIQRLP